MKSPGKTIILQRKAQNDVDPGLGFIQRAGTAIVESKFVLKMKTRFSHKHPLQSPHSSCNFVESLDVDAERPLYLFFSHIYPCIPCTVLKFLMSGSVYLVSTRREEIRIIYIRAAEKMCINRVGVPLKRKIWSSCFCCSILC